MLLQCSTPFQEMLMFHTHRPADWRWTTDTVPNTIQCCSLRVVPEKGRKRALDLLHEAHPGMARMKSLARGYMWWPGLDKDIEGCVKESHLPVHKEVATSSTTSPLVLAWEETSWKKWMHNVAEVEDELHFILDVQHSQKRGNLYWWNVWTGY